MNTSPKNGRSLERAVRFIQETILNSDPKLKGSGFTIENNKVVTVSGVRHEIDVLVKTLPDSAYESSWIFECKDWKKPVGKNEVIVLAAKVDALGANKGFLVARQVTRDATAQLAKDRRLGFIECSDEFLSPFHTLQVVHASYELFPMRISAKERGVQPKENPDVLDWKDCKCIFEQKPVEFIDLIKPWVDELVLEKREGTIAKLLQPGTHFDKRARLVVFDRGDLWIGEAEYENMVIEVQFFCTVERKKLISKFELKGQGCWFSFDPIKDFLIGHQLKIDVVHRV